MIKKIISDSCYDLPDKLLKKMNIDIVPMSLIFNDKVYKEKINITDKDFYNKLKMCEESPSSASPSPADFMKYINDINNIFIVTISSALSSSYNNALLAKELYNKKHDNNNFIHIFDSLNASIGQGLILLKLNELIQNNKSINEIITSVEDYSKKLNTFFLLDNLNNLINSGRLNKIMGKLISILNIKLIMGKNINGDIKLFKKVRGSRKAFNKLIDIIGETDNNFENKTLGIAHYKCREKAEKFKKCVENKYNFNNIIITSMGPTIATYADENSLLISF